MKFQPPKGTRDLTPEVSRKYQFVLDAIRKVFEKYGFQQLNTPAFETFDLLAKKGGQSIKDEIYYFKDKSKRELGLRFDFTVSGARFITNNPNIPLPFKAYQIGKVWRYDQPQAYRFREFWQADIDIIGTKSPIADAECLAVVTECLEKLGFKDFCIRINDRKLIEKLIREAGVKKDILEIFRTIDKLDKIGVEGIKKELKSKGVDANKILNILKTKKESQELKELLDFAGKLGIKKKLKLDLSLVRGLDYYTGLVFEVMIGKTRVSCGGGGRYDKLIKTIGGPDLPATGISFGIDRIVALMDEKKMFKEVTQKTGYFVVSVNDSVKPQAIKIVQKLRKKGESVEMDLMGRNLSKQMAYANKNKILKVIIVGPKEIKKRKVIIKIMKTGKEKKISLTNI